ncbi:MAG: murein hydrolase activator EnvC family protein [Flavobacteriales bacterium]
MRLVNKITLAIVFLAVHGICQQNPDNLKKEQRKLEKKIAQTKSLLKKVQANSNTSLKEVRLLDNQIKSREALVRVFDSQVRMAEIKILQKKNDVSRLKKRLIKLKSQYRKMLRFAYKKRNNTGRLMFLLSARTYQEALRRNSYLKKVAHLQRRQVDLIKQHRALIEREIGAINSEKTEKELTLNEKKAEKSKIEADKQQKEKSYSKLKKEEEKLLTQLKEEEKKRKKIESQIQSAILAEARKEEQRRKEKEKTKTAANTPVSEGNKPQTKPSTPTPTYKPETLSSEGSAAGKNFENNKGTLPSPVSNGTITSRFGKNAHPTLKDVYENNNGIDISCSAGAGVRAVFEGEVSSVFSIAGAGKVVIIKHGNYRSVYSNLSSVSVSVGQKVSAKQNLGTLISEGNISTLHFEIHSVSGINTTPLNPSVWLSR